MPTEHRCCISASVGLAAAGIIFVSPGPTPSPNPDPADIRLAAGAAPTSVVIDIVRHGQRMPPTDLQDTHSPPYPGVSLSDLGQQHADDVANQLFRELGPHVAGIFSGQGLRDTETAASFFWTSGTS